MEIIDNVLNKYDWDKIYPVVAGMDFPWFWSPGVISDSTCNELDNYQFCNTVYYPPQILQSNYLSTFHLYGNLFK